MRHRIGGIAGMILVVLLAANSGCRPAATPAPGNTQERTRRLRPPV